MSRIHEALKKAEQDRAAAQGPRIESFQTETIVAPPTNGSENPPHALHTVPPVSSQFTLETLLARCVPGNWLPDKKTMLFYDSDQAHGTEEFRTLRSRLYQMREKHPLKKVLVTSSLPKEGKSFVAANLAQVLVRQQGRRALLIDGDLRAARLHVTLGTAAAPGLSDYLRGEADEFGIMQRGTYGKFIFRSSRKFQLESRGTGGQWPIETLAQPSRNVIRLDHYRFAACGSSLRCGRNGQHL